MNAHSIMVTVSITVSTTMGPTPVTVKWAVALMMMEEHVLVSCPPVHVA